MIKAKSTSAPLTSMEKAKMKMKNRNRRLEADVASLASRESRRSATSKKKSETSNNKKSKPVVVVPPPVSLGAMLDRNASNRSLHSSPPMDEISVGSSMSDRSNTTEITMTSRTSIVRELPKNLGRSGSTRTFGRQSSHRSMVSTASSTCGGASMLAETSTSLDHTHILGVQQLWQKVKLIETYKDDLPEQTILRMLEIDAGTRKKLRLPSLRSSRYDVIANVILQVVEDVVSMLGPDLEDFAEELHVVALLCQKEGIDAKLLGESTGAGLAVLLPDDFDSEKHKIWKNTFDHIARAMTKVSEFGF